MKKIFTFLVIIMALVGFTSCMMSNGSFLYSDFDYLLKYAESPKNYSDEKAVSIIKSFGKGIAAEKVISVIKEFDEERKPNVVERVDDLDSWERIHFFFNDKPKSIKLYAVIATIYDTNNVLLKDKKYVRNLIATIDGNNICEGNYTYGNDVAYDCEIILDKSWYNLWYDFIEDYPDSESFLTEKAIYWNRGFSSIKLESGTFILAEVEYDNGNTALVENVSYLGGKAKLPKVNQMINLVTGNKAEVLGQIKPDLNTISLYSKYSYCTTYWK